MRNQNIIEISNCLWYLRQIFSEILPELFFDAQKRFLEKKSRRQNFDMIKYIYLKILRSTPDELLRTHSEIH